MARAWADVGQLIARPGYSAAGKIEAVAQHRQEAELPTHKQRRPDVGLAKSVKQGFGGVKKRGLGLGVGKRLHQDVGDSLQGAQGGGVRKMKGGSLSFRLGYGEEAKVVLAPRAPGQV